MTTQNGPHGCWLAVAVATLWAAERWGRGGRRRFRPAQYQTSRHWSPGSADAACHPPAARECLSPGLDPVLVALLDQAPLPMGRFVPEPWPAVSEPEETPLLPALEVPLAA